MKSSMEEAPSASTAPERFDVRRLRAAVWLVRAVGGHEQKGAARTIEKPDPWWRSGQNAANEGVGRRGW